MDSFGIGFESAPGTVVPSLTSVGSGEAIAFYGYLSSVAAYSDRGAQARWLSETAAVTDQCTFISSSRLGFDVFDTTGAICSLTLASVKPLQI